MVILFPFREFGAGALLIIVGKMDCAMYRQILEMSLILSVSKWTFQQDNDHNKHTAFLSREWFNKRKLNVLQWPSKSPELNPIDDLL